MDNQLPAALARWLAAEGHDAHHVLDLNLGQADDREVWRCACERGAVLITKDADFLDRAVFVAGPQVVWLRLGNCRNPALLDAFASVLPHLLAELESGCPVVEVR